VFHPSRSNTALFKTYPPRIRSFLHGYIVAPYTFMRFWTWLFRYVVRGDRIYALLFVFTIVVTAFLQTASYSSGHESLGLFSRTTNLVSVGIPVHHLYSSPGPSASLTRAYLIKGRLHPPPSISRDSLSLTSRANYSLRVFRSTVSRRRTLHSYSTLSHILS